MCSDWVHIFNNHEKNNLPGIRPSGQASPDEIHIRGADTTCNRDEQHWESGASQPEKCL